MRALNDSGISRVAIHGWNFQMFLFFEIVGYFSIFQVDILGLCNMFKLSGIRFLMIFDLIDFRICFQICGFLNLWPVFRVFAASQFKFYRFGTVIDGFAVFSLHQFQFFRFFDFFYFSDFNCNMVKIPSFIFNFFTLRTFPN